MPTATQQWLIAWFREQSPDAAKASEADLVDADFFEHGFIDSFGVIVLVEEIETAFSIKFDEASFQDRRFPVISGLAEIIDERAR